MFSTTLNHTIPGDSKVLKPVDMVINRYQKFEFESHTQIRKMEGIISIIFFKDDRLLTSERNITFSKIRCFRENNTSNTNR